MRAVDGRLVRSFLIAAGLGLVAFLLSRSELSWLLAAAIFYNEYVVQSGTKPVSKRGRR